MCLCPPSAAFMNNITEHLICLLAWWNQSSCCEPTEQRMRWISLFSWFAFKLFPWKPLIMQNYSFHKEQTWTFTRKPFSQDQEQVSEGSNTADSDKSRRKEMAGERGEERQGRRSRREWVPKPLNEIKALYKTPLINIVELISSSSSALVGSWKPEWCLQHSSGWRPISYLGFSHGCG